MVNKIQWTDLNRVYLNGEGLALIEGAINKAYGDLLDTPIEYYQELVEILDPKSFDGINLRKLLICYTVAQNGIKFGGNSRKRMAELAVLAMAIKATIALRLDYITK